MEVMGDSQKGGDEGEEGSMPGSPMTLPRSSSFSPKVTRPKLPQFVSPLPSPHSRSDQGREDIKTILEDIENLKKINFDKFKRPRHTHPSAFATLPRRPHSTSTSPCHTPRISSPTVDDSRSSRDRLKLLTTYLKNRSGKLLSEQNAPSDTGQRDLVQEGSVKAELSIRHGPSPDFCSVERVLEEDEEEDVQKDLDPQKPRTPRISPASSVSVARLSPQLSVDSLDSRKTQSHSGSNTPDPQPLSQSREQTPDGDSHVQLGGKPVHTSTADDKPPGSDTVLSSPEDRDRQASHSTTLQEHQAEDEGVSEISDTPRPMAPSHTYHPTIGRNKQFWTLVARDPFPMRRPGLTTLASASRMQVAYTKPLGEEPDQRRGEESGTRSRHPRRSEAGSNSGQKAAPRFITHPPHSKGSIREEGSMDSNGFAALKTSVGDSDDESKQQSQLSLADSQLTSEEADDLTFQDVVDSVMAGPASESSDSDKQEKKNGKASKQKSRSDPNGNRSRESLDFTPNMDTGQSHSAPMLNRSQSESFDEDSHHVSGSDSTLSPTSQGVIVDSDGEQSSDNDDDMDMEGSGESVDVLPSSPSESGYSHSHSSTSIGQQPPSQPPLLSVPPRRRIPRSASSASEFQTRKTLSGSGRSGRDNQLKYAVTSEDTQPSRSSARSLADFTPLAESSPATSMPVVWKDQPTYTVSPERESGFKKDKRYHIVEELYRNEKEYVEALRVLKEKYMAPLKNCSSVDDAIVDNIFYMIPEILMHHSVYLDLLDQVWKSWDSKTSTIGDLILAIFSKQTVLESYMSFVENYNTSGKVIENALTTKSSMQKFVEQCQRDSGSKLSMKDLIVRPIQRIPRYELLIQRLLDNTAEDHPDYRLLQQACRAMHELALKIGTVTDSQQEEDMQETLKKLELLLITDLVAPERAYIRHDMVQLLVGGNKKDQCCVWLFSDLIILSIVKRKSGPVTRKVSIILKTPSGQDFTENIKHKVWLKVGLDCLEIVKSHVGTLNRKPTIDKDQVEEDLQILNQISDLCCHLYTPHPSLDEALKELNTTLNKQLTEVMMRSMASESNKLELQVTTQEGVIQLEIGFASAEKRASWELAFTDAKNKLSLLTNKRAPEFLQPLQITKTRAGMQFSCAAPIDGLNSRGFRDVWVCNSDGYVGHMCLLSLQPEPIVTLNTPVPGCNARILCICAVPTFGGAFRRRCSQKGRSHQGSEDMEQLPFTHVDSPDHSKHVQVAPPIDKRRQVAGGSSHTRERQMKREEEEEVDNMEEGYQSDSESSEDEDDDEDAIPFMRNNDLYVGDLLSDEEVYRPKVSELTQNSPDPISTTGCWQQDPHKSTMWLGTEDGCIHIFQCTDNIKTTKNKLKIQHGSPVQCIVYLDNKVFVSLVNGDLIVYKRDSEGLWDTEHPYIRTIGSATAPITRMLAVAGKLWCGCQNTVHVINPLALNTECSFQVMSDSSRAVQCMVCSGQGVWVACQQSAKVSLFHATTYDFLLEVSVASAVTQKLQSADDIIRQHKTACLRITSLLVCKDLLWVGTSAGVILTVPIPKITSTTTHGALAMPTVTGLVYGHTGHVRFLTAVELWNVNAGQKGDTSTTKDSHGRETVILPDLKRRSSVAAAMATMATRMLVISGGDGYEDFRNNSAGELAGRDDSTNHLLLWQA